jgi:hypothetical protein
MDSFHTSCGNWTWEKNTRVRPSQNWAQKTQSSKQRAKKGPPQKKEKKKKKKSVHTKTYALWKNCVSTYKRHALHSMV